MGSARAALLLLTDGRLPAGGYAHSGGLEPSVLAGRVQDLPTLESFLIGRAGTAGLVAAGFAAAAAGAITDGDEVRLEALDSELDARMPSPAQRATSRQLGRQMLRALESVAPHGSLPHLGSRPHLPLVVGGACAAFLLGRLDAALAALHDSVAGPAAAAVRLLSLDPFGVHAVLARLAPVLDALAEQAVEHASGAPEDLPAAAAPLLDICAEQHAMRTRRLFAS